MSGPPKDTSIKPIGVLPEEIGSDSRLITEVQLWAEPRLRYGKIFHGPIFGGYFQGVEDAGQSQAVFLRWLSIVTMVAVARRRRRSVPVGLQVVRD